MSNTRPARVPTSAHTDSRAWYLVAALCCTVAAIQLAFDAWGAMRTAPDGRAPHGIATGVVTLVAAAVIALASFFAIRQRLAASAVVVVGYGLHAIGSLALTGDVPSPALGMWLALLALLGARAADESRLMRRKFVLLGFAVGVVSALLRAGIDRWMTFHRAPLLTVVRDNGGIAITFGIVAALLSGLATFASPPTPHDDV